MEKKHREAIQKNFSSLVEQTDLDLMVTALYEKGVFSDPMIEPYRDTSKDVRTRKRQLYSDVTRRGPDAFHNLLDALSENGYWNLVRCLDPESALHTPSSRTAPSQGSQGKRGFFSLSDKNRERTGKEQDDPNKNMPNQITQSNNNPDKHYSKSDEKLNEGAAAGPARPRPESAAASQPARPLTPGAAGDAPDHLAGEIPQFNVIKSKKFFEDNSDNDIKLYVTRGRLRGVLVLFSYIAFQHDIERYREGARVDSSNLQYLFAELGFKTLVYFNRPLQETRAALENLKNSGCAEGAETIFVVFSSHGYARSGSGDTDIRCSDGHLISYYEIIEYFNNEKFPALIGIPKVFIFQTCRGSNTDHGVSAPQPMPAPRPALAPRRPARAHNSRTAHDGRSYTSDGNVYESDDEHKVRDRTYSDILIAHSTVPGYTSNRDKVSGSWYIQALCEVFAARAHDCHVEKLFTLVDMELRKRFTTQTSSVDRWGFNRRLYLHPGLYED